MFEAPPCRACGRSLPQQAAISLGYLPLGNSLLTRDQLDLPESRYPIDLVLCDTCALLQIREPISASALASQIPYYTSTSPSLLAHQAALAETLLAERGLGPNTLVVEIGSNDGSFLAAFAQANVPVLGIEPVESSARLAGAARQVPTLARLFTSDLARDLRAAGKTARLILANYVLELVPALDDFIAGLRILLDDDGLAMLEVPYVRDVIEQARVDAIAHVRVNWFSATSLDSLFKRHDLMLTDIQHLPHFRGGTLRLFVGHASRSSQTSALTSLIDGERRAGLDTNAFYAVFDRRVQAARRKLRELLGDARRRSGVLLAGYGAGIKASTLLNYFHLGPDLLDFVVDLNPHKQDLYMPGVHVPTAAPKRLLEARPLYTVLLALDFVDEVLSQQAEYRMGGGRFIIPVPDLVLA